MTLFKGRYRIPSARLKGWDYAQPGVYFITICTRDRVYFFGEVVNGDMRLSRIGEAARQFWSEIPRHFPHVALDAFVVMPNHIHGLIIIKPADPTTVDNATAADDMAAAEDMAAAVQTRRVASLHNNRHLASAGNAAPSNPAAFGPLRPGSVSKIVQAYKAAVTRWCRQTGHTAFAWQPRFYDRIVRDETGLRRVRLYIERNPARWNRDLHRWARRLR